MAKKIARKIDRNEIVGHRILEVIPVGEYSDLVLDNGRRVESSLSGDEFTEPKHPEIVSKIFSLEAKLYDAKYAREDKSKQKKYIPQIRELLGLLVGKKYTFCNQPCLVTEVLTEGRARTHYAVIQQGVDTRKVELYSLER